MNQLSIRNEKYHIAQVATERAEVNSLILSNISPQFVEALFFIIINYRNTQKLHVAKQNTRSRLRREKLFFPQNSFLLHSTFTQITLWFD